MLHQFLSILAFCVLAVAAFGLGRPILRGLRIGQEDRLSIVVWSIALGLIAAGIILTALGFAGGLYAPLIGAATVVACFVGGGEIVRAYRAAHEQEGVLAVSDYHETTSNRPAAPWAAPSRWLLGGLFCAAGVACLGSLIGALAPPTAGDALCYHLELPKVFLAEHRIVYLPYSDNATFPLLAEMWFLWALALDGGTCAQLVHWGLGVLLALATVVLATPIIGRNWAWIAGALVVLVPGINNQMTAPLNDVALSAMTTLAMAAWWKAAVEEDDYRWFVVAGLTGGAALATKYVALLFAVAVAATWLWQLIRQPKRRRFLARGAAVAMVVAVSVGGIWYVRAVRHRGNPVFPLLAEVFPGRESVRPPARETLPDSKSPLGRGPMGLALAPWQLTMHPERFGGRGHQLGCLLLAAVPGIVFSRRLRGLGLLLAVASIYGATWYLLRQNVRFLFPIVPLLCAASVWVWIEMRRFPEPARRIAATAFIGLLAVLSAVGLTRGRDRLAVAVGWQNREQYLLQHEPTYRAAAVANTVLGSKAHILSQDYRGFYFNSRVTRESIYRRHTQYDRGLDGTADLSSRLRKAGFSHLLLAETAAGPGIAYDPTLSRLADSRTATDSDESLLTLTDYRFKDSDGAVRRYRLVMLK